MGYEKEEQADIGNLKGCSCNKKVKVATFTFWESKVSHYAIFLFGVSFINGQLFDVWTSKIGGNFYSRSLVANSHIRISSK